MKSLLVILLVVGFVGCSSKNTDGQVIRRAEESCLNGWVYFYSRGEYTSYMTPKYGPDQKLIPCSMDEAVDE